MTVSGPTQERLCLWDLTALCRLLALELAHEPLGWASHGSLSPSVGTAVSTDGAVAPGHQRCDGTTSKAVAAGTGRERQAGQHHAHNLPHERLPRCGSGRSDIADGRPPYRKLQNRRLRRPTKQFRAAGGPGACPAALSRSSTTNIWLGARGPVGVGG